MSTLLTSKSFKCWSMNTSQVMNSTPGEHQGHCFLLGLVWFPYGVLAACDINTKKSDFFHKCIGNEL